MVNIEGKNRAVKNIVGWSCKDLETQ